MTSQIGRDVDAQYELQTSWEMSVYLLLKTRMANLNVEDCRTNTRRKEKEGGSDQRLSK